MINLIKIALARLGLYPASASLYVAPLRTIAEDLSGHLKALGVKHKKAEVEIEHVRVRYDRDVGKQRAVMEVADKDAIAAAKMALAIRSLLGE